MNMNEDLKPVSKVLVLDNDAASLSALRQFCEANKLSGLRVGRYNLLSVLKTNVDLGGVFISEQLGNEAQAGLALARQVRQLRPELPIFLRREVTHGTPTPASVDCSWIAATYTLDTLDRLDEAVRDNIFNTSYPAALVRGIGEVILKALQSQFRDVQVSLDPAYLVRDQIIYGELFTLIPVDTSWCRGYMTLQAEEESLQQLVRAGKSQLSPSDADDFRSLNLILGELTNLIWGGFRNRYTEVDALDLRLSQVPIVVNHMHRFISFGSTNPQLCFRCTLTDPNDDSLAPVIILQRFVFNLSWSPENFHENETTMNSLVDSGELELF